MSYNLGNLSKEEKDKINADKAAAAVYAERHDIENFNALKIEHDLPEEIRVYFRERLKYYRSK